MEQKKNSGTKSRKLTIGFLTAQVNQDVGKEIYASIIKSAKAHNVNLICYFGGITKNFIQGIYKVTIDSFLFINNQNIDGLIIWTSSLRICMEYSEIEKFIKEKLSIPVISLVVPFKNVPCIQIDNKQGIRETMQHLVENHGYRKIGFIQAEKEHEYAADRLAGYLEALAKYKIPVNDDLITPAGDFLPRTGIRAAATFFDERKLKPQRDLEAIVAASDKQIIGLMNAFEKRDIKVPRDIAVVGFNNNFGSITIDPALTTVEPHISRHGEMAVASIIELIKGNRVPEKIYIQTELIVRQSCGCCSTVINQTTVEDIPDIKNRAVSKEVILAELEKQSPRILAVLNAKFKDIDKIIPMWCNKLLESYILDISTMDTRNILLLLESFLSIISKKNGDILKWIEIISEIRILIIPLLHNTELLIHSENIFHQSRIMVDNIIDIYREKFIHGLSWQNYNLVELGQMLNASLSVEDLKKIIESQFLKVEIGVNEYYLLLFKNYSMASHSVKLVISGSRKKIHNEDGKEFPLKELIIKDLVHKKDDFCILYKPLYINDDQFGFLLFDVELDDYNIYEAIRQQISTALHSILYIEEEKRAKTEREKLLEELEEKNMELKKTMNALWGEMEPAKKIQTSLLPKNYHIEGYKIIAFMKPAEEVGGDFYNIMQGEDGKNWIHFGDVTGHGITSGLIMLMLMSSLLTNVLTRPELTPGELVVLSNDIIYYFLKSRLMLEHYITNCFFKFDQEGHFTYAGAHLDILIYRGKTKNVERLETDGVWLGLIENLDHAIVENTFQLCRDDVLFLYTDGVTECMNAEEEFYDMDRLLLFLERHGDMEPEEIAKEMVKEIENFQAQQLDDYSFLIVKKA